MNFLIADVMQFVSGTVITFSQGSAARIKSNLSSFQSWAPGLISGASHEVQLQFQSKVETAFPLTLIFCSNK